MALANGLLLHGPRHWAAAVMDDDGEVIVASGPRPRIARGATDRIPLARGVIRMAELLMVVPTARAGLPEARTAGEDGWLGPIMAMGMVANAILRRTTRSVLAQEAIAAAVGLVPVLIALRMSDASLWHAVEHKTIAAYERGGPDGVADSATDPKEHHRCGSNLIVPMVLSTAIGNILARRVHGRRRRLTARAGALALGIGTAVELFAFAERRPHHPVSTAVHQTGHAIQAHFVTREPGEAELAVGRAAMTEILRAERGPRG